MVCLILIPDENVLQNDIIFLTENQLLPDTDVSCIKRRLKNYYSDFKFSSLAICHKGSVTILDHEKHSGVSLLPICIECCQENS